MNGFARRLVLKQRQKATQNDIVLLVSAQNYLASTQNYIVMQMRKANLEKGLFNDHKEFLAKRFKF